MIESGRITSIVAQPFEFLLSIGCTIYGVVTVIGGMGATGVIDDNFNTPVTFVWAVSLVLGGLGTLAGIALMITRIRLAGVTMLAGGVTLYGILLVFTHGVSENLAPITLTMIGLAFGARAYSLRKIVAGEKLAARRHD